MNAAARTRKIARRLFRDCFVNGLLDDDRARQVVVYVIQAGQRGSLGVLSHFRHFVRVEHDRHVATIESATPLPDDLRARVESQLALRYGSFIESNFVCNPSLIGGMRIRIGSDVYEDSIRGRLAEIEARM